MRRSEGFSLIELLVVCGVVVAIAAMAVPLLRTTVDDVRVASAARYLAGRLRLARMEAVKRSLRVGLRIDAPDTGYRFAFYADGNRNGIRATDIARGADPRLTPPERLAERFPGVTFGVVDDVRPIDPGDAVVPGADPIRLGRSDILTFSPDGTATSGTLYIRGVGRRQFAVRVLGSTGRARVFQFDNASGEWIVR